MEFTAVAADLVGVLNLVRHVIPARTTVPTLSNVLIRARQGQITLTGTDLVTEVSVVEACDVTKDGDVTVSAQVLFDLLKAMPAKELVTLKSTKIGRISVSSGRAAFALGTLPADDFPSQEAVDGNPFEFEISASELAEMIDATRYTALTNMQDRYYLQGIHLYQANNQLVMISTDGHHLARLERGLPKGLDAGAAGIIIPNAAIKTMASILSSCEEKTAKVRFNDRRIWLDVGSVSFVSKLVVGTFPDVDRLIPDAQGSCFSVKASELGAALDRLKAVYSGTDAKAPVVMISAANGEVEVRGGRENGDQGRETIEANVGTKVSFGVSALLLSSLVKMWPPGALLEIHSGNPSAPVRITSPDVSGLKHVVMPMNPGALSRSKDQEAEAA